MITKAEESGELTKDKTILEPTSGNTGIAIAMIGAAKGYEVQLCMPECVSTERRLILEGLGVHVFLTPAKENIDGAIREAQSLVKQPSRQVLHAQPVRQRGQRARALRDHRPRDLPADRRRGGLLRRRHGHLRHADGRRHVPEVGQAVRADRRASSRSMGHTIQGLKNMTESMMPGIYHPEELDLKEMVDDGEAFDTTRLLATREGLFVGTSAGAAVAVALRLAGTIDRGTIVVILPDRGDRYLSTMQFRSVCAKCPP